MKKIKQAILKCQQQIGYLTKDAINPHFKSKYIKLPTLLSQVLPILQEHNILFSCSQIDNLLCVELYDTESGEFIQNKIPLLGASDMQKLGSAYTYAQRIGLLSLLGLSAGEDDDGNRASLNMKNDLIQQIKELIDNVPRNVDDEKIQRSINLIKKFDDTYFNNLTIESLRGHIKRVQELMEEI